MNNIYLDKINYYNEKNNIYKLNKYIYKYYNLYGGVGENKPLSIIGNKISLQSKNIISNLTNQSKNIINNVNNQSKNIISNLTNQSKNIINNVNNLSKNTLSNITNQSKNIVTNITNQSKDMIDKSINIILDIDNKLKDNYNESITKIKNLFNKENNNYILNNLSIDELDKIVKYPNYRIISYDDNKKTYYIYGKNIKNLDLIKYLNNHKLYIIILLNDIDINLTKLKKEDNNNHIIYTTTDYKNIKIDNEIIFDKMYSIKKFITKIKNINLNDIKNSAEKTLKSFSNADGKLISPSIINKTNNVNKIFKTIFNKNQKGGRNYDDYLIIKILEHHKNIKCNNEYYKILVILNNSIDIKCQILDNKTNNILSQEIDVLKSYMNNIDNYNKSNKYLLFIRKNLFSDDEKNNIIKYIDYKLGYEWTILGARQLSLYLLMRDNNNIEKKFNISKCIKFFLMIDYNDFFNNYFLYENLLFFLFNNIE
jgi:hypothetical protein